MLVAQISDCHVVADDRLLFGHVPTNAMLEAAIARINALVPAVDAIVATGDLVESGKPEEYARLRSIVSAAKAPVYLLPGNHDDRQALRSAFRDHDYLGDEGPLSYAIDHAGVALVALDTTVPGEPHGAFTEASDVALRRLLDARKSAVAMVFTHHPPFATGIWWMDAIGVKGGRRFAEAVRAFPNIERVACGHIHRSIARRWAGTVASVAPSTAHQLALDLGDTAFLGLTLEPAGFDLHAIDAARGIVSHTCSTETAPLLSHLPPQALAQARSRMEVLRAAFAAEERG